MLPAGGDPNIWQHLAANLGLGFCSFIGSLMAISVDCPSKWRDGVFRLGCGFALGVFFAPALAYFAPSGDNMTVKVAVGAGLGMISWYVLGGIVRAGQKTTDGSLFATLFQKFLGYWFPWLKSGEDTSKPPTDVPQAPPVNPLSPNITAGT